MQQAARVSDYTAYMYIGELIEFGITDTIFIKPKIKRQRTTLPDVLVKFKYTVTGKILIL